MDNVTVEVTYKTFMGLAAGKSKKTLSAAQLAEIGDFSALSSVQSELLMYPIFVSRYYTARRRR